MLNLPPICRLACTYPNGLVLVTGPTGSGKSTTLAAMINHINMNEKSHIITLEDPVEFQHDSKKCMMNQRELTNHFTSFSAALKAALREDPDVILVGELRDTETISLAITAAETGHLVFGTLHTNSAPKSLDRIIDSFEGSEQAQIRSMLSESLRVIISQKLVQTADGKSRMAFHDILVNNNAIANLIREGKTFQIPSIMQTAKKDGMQVLDHMLLEAVKAGVVEGTTAWEAANEKALFAQYAPKDFLNLANNASYAGKTGLDTSILTAKKPTGT
jgi:twitching motility protein PilT